MLDLEIDMSLGGLEICMFLIIFRGGFNRENVLWGGKGLGFERLKDISYFK